MGLILLSEPKVNKEVVFTLECRMLYWTLMARFRSQGSYGSIGDGQISTGTGFPPSTSVYTCQSTLTPMIYIHVHSCVITRYIYYSRYGLRR